MSGGQDDPQFVLLVAAAVDDLLEDGRQSPTSCGACAACRPRSSRSRRGPRAGRTSRCRSAPRRCTPSPGTPGSMVKPPWADVHDQAALAGPLRRVVAATVSTAAGATMGGVNSRAACCDPSLRGRALNATSPAKRTTIAIIPRQPNPAIFKQPRGDAMATFLGDQVASSSGRTRSDTRASPDYSVGRRECACRELHITFAQVAGNPGQVMRSRFPPERQAGAAEEEGELGGAGRRMPRAGGRASRRRRTRRGTRSRAP